MSRPWYYLALREVFAQLEEGFSCDLRFVHVA